jgi:hypothetical protein
VKRAVRHTISVLLRDVCDRSVLPRLAVDSAACHLGRCAFMLWTMGAIHLRLASPLIALSTSNGISAGSALEIFTANY